MRSYLKYLACFLVISVSSCKKFIDLLPVDQANSENSFQSPADANLAVAGIYDALHSNPYAQDMALGILPVPGFSGERHLPLITPS